MFDHVPPPKDYVIYLVRDMILFHVLSEDCKFSKFPVFSSFSLLFFSLILTKSSLVEEIRCIPLGRQMVWQDSRSGLKASMTASGLVIARRPYQLD